MKRLFYFLAAAAMLVGCSDEYDDSALKGEIDDLKDKVTNLEQQINALKQEALKINDDIAAMKAIADGIAITKVTENADGGYTVNFSDGKSFTIANGQKGDQGQTGPQGPQGEPCTPMMRIDSEGYWQVSYDGGSTWEYPAGEKVSALGQTGATGDQGAQGAQGATPMLSVDAEGYWVVSYDGGATYERMKDAAGNEVKAVVSEGTGDVTYKSVFESVTYSAENSTLVVVLAGTTEELEIPVGGKALAQLYAGENPIEDVQVFAYAEKKSYTVKAPTADMVKVVGYPDGWTVTLTDMTLDVTAPAAQSRATADSATDVSLLVVMKNGLATVLRMQVKIDGTAVEPVALATPVVTLTPASVTAGAEQAVVATWEAVANATSYQVSFNGAAATSVTEATYTIAAADVKALAKGEYKLSVVAVPTDAAYTESAAGEATLTVTEATTPPATGDVLEWSSSVFEQLYNSIGTENYTADVDLGNGMKFIAGEGKCKFGKSGDDYRIQLGGSGNTTSCTLQFTVAGPGTLEVDIQSSGSGDRYLAVAIDGTEVNADGFVAPDSSASRQVHTIDCSAAKAGSVINLYSKKSAINVYKVKWTSK
ncbi:MAG: hypothetical protein IJB62_06825 [Alistipes sp.]|nr:hypothetical protein [Alistipes sp.]